MRKEAEDITPDYPNLKELIENMFETKMWIWQLMFENFYSICGTFIGGQVVL